MEIYNLKDMIKGWFVGNFEPTIIKTEAFEVGVKNYKAGDKEEWHVHKIATEITVILNGTVEMNNKKFESGDIIVLRPNNGTDFKALSDVSTVVVKVPSAKGDKYNRGGVPC